MPLSLHLRSLRLGALHLRSLRLGTVGRRPQGRPEPRVPLTGIAAPPVGGRTLSGEAAAAEQPAGLVLFMTSGCTACREVWAGLGAGRAAALPGGPDLLVVVPDPALEPPKGIAALAPAGLRVVMSTEAWHAYRAGPAPWVVAVAGGLVVAEGVAGGWPGVEGLARRRRSALGGDGGG